MQHAIDAEADHQGFFLRLDMDVGGAHFQRLFEHRVEQLDYRRIFGTGSEAELERMKRSGVAAMMA